MDDAIDERKSNVKLLGLLVLGVLLAVFGIAIKGPKTFTGGVLFFLISLAELFRRAFFSLGRKGRIVMVGSIVGILVSGVAYGSYAFVSAKKEALRASGLEWRKHFEAGEVGSLRGIDINLDGNIWFAGSGENGIYGLINPDGKVLIKEMFFSTGYYSLSAVNSLNDGGALLMGRGDDEEDKNVGLIVRVDNKGGVVWKRFYGEQPEKRTLDNSSEINSAIILDDGDAIVVGRSRTYPYAARINPSGDIVWEQTYDGFGEGVLHDIALRSPDTFIAVGNRQVSGLKDEAYARLMNVNGEKEVAFTWGGEKIDRATALHVSDDGRVLIGAQRSALGDDLGGDIVLSRLKEDGVGRDLIGRYYGPLQGWNGVFAIGEHPSGGFILGGYSRQRDSEGDSYATIIHVSTNGLVRDSWFLPSHHGTSIYDMVVLPNGDQIIAGKAPHPNKYRPSMFIARRKSFTQQKKGEIIRYGQSQEQ